MKQNDEETAVIPSAKGRCDWLCAGFHIIVNADVAHLPVLIHKALVLLFATQTAFMDSNPYECREEGSVENK